MTIEKTTEQKELYNKIEYHVPDDGKLDDTEEEVIQQLFSSTLEHFQTAMQEHVPFKIVIGDTLAMVISNNKEELEAMEQHIGKTTQSLDLSDLKFIKKLPMPNKDWYKNLLTLPRKKRKHTLQKLFASQLIWFRKEALKPKED